MPKVPGHPGMPPKFGKRKTGKAIPRPGAGAKITKPKKI
jgi:hypothetical protein